MDSSEQARLLLNRPRCDKCYFWRTDIDDVADYGRCHYHAPRAHSGGNSFPRTANKDWCRRWRRADCFKVFDGFSPVEKRGD
jgi:hypothetical protein